MPTCYMCCRTCSGCPCDQDGECADCGRAICRGYTVCQSCGDDRYAEAEAAKTAPPPSAKEIAAALEQHPELREELRAILGGS